MDEFANLSAILQKDVRRYGSLYKERFRLIDLNIDNDTHIKKYIYHPQVVSLLKLPQSKLLLYNSWETRGLYKCIPVIRHYCNYHSIPTSKLFLSMTDHQHMFKRYPTPRVISYDWQYIHAKMKFSREKPVDQQAHKSKHLICFNSRTNGERLAATAYLYTKHREKCHLSFLNNKRSHPIKGEMLSLVKHFVSHHKFLSFKKAIPISLERKDCQNRLLMHISC